MSAMRVGGGGGSGVAGATAGAKPEIRTLGELRRAGYRARTVKQELREHAIVRLRAGEPLIPGVVGYGETVEPQIAAALLSGHDLLLLGLRGQAKTRILRSLTGLLDEWMPAIARTRENGVELHEDPLHPTTRAGREAVEGGGDETPIEWVHRSERYTEKLATPDVTVADLIGEVDIVKHAEGRYLGDERTMHLGLIPRANRGIFAINELPDLAPRIQVGLFNVLEERDVQIRGYSVRLELDLSVVFSANPEDYTNRGRIVTPLKDRIGSVVRTHYPDGGEEAMRITRENAFLERGEGRRVSRGAGNGVARGGEGAAKSVTPVLSLAAAPATPMVKVPRVIHAIVEEVIGRARGSAHINQASGVSVRASIAALENVVSSAEMRGLRTGETTVGARVCDLGAALAGVRGKVELMISEDGATGGGKSTEDRLLDALLGEAVREVVSEDVPVESVADVADRFRGGIRLEMGDRVSAKDAIASMKHVEGLMAAAERMGKAVGLDAKDDQERACAGELVLEYLYVNNRLSKVGRAYAR